MTEIRKMVFENELDVDGPFEDTGGDEWDIWVDFKTVVEHLTDYGSFRFDTEIEDMSIMRFGENDPIDSPSLKGAVAVLLKDAVVSAAEEFTDKNPVDDIGSFEFESFVASKFQEKLKKVSLSRFAESVIVISKCNGNVFFELVDNPSLEELTKDLESKGCEWIIIEKGFAVNEDIVRLAFMSFLES